MIRDSLGEEKSNMYIERGKKSIALLKEILAIPSVNGADNEGAVAEFIANYLKEKHIDAFVQQIDETHANIIAKLRGSLQKLLYGMDTLIQFHMEAQKSGIQILLFQWRRMEEFMHEEPVI